MYKSIIEQFNEYNTIIETLSKDESFLEKLEQMARVIIGSLRNGKAIYIAGNGGSAAEAQHIAAELSGKFEIDRPALNVEALHVNSSYMTAVANDYGFEDVFSRLLRGRGKRGDVFIALTTSGNSTNVVNAAKAALTKQMSVLGMTGRSGGKLANSCDIILKIPSDSTARIQEIHLMIGHWLCRAIEQEFYGDERIMEEE